METIESYQDQQKITELVDSEIVSELPPVSNLTTSIDSDDTENDTENEEDDTIDDLIEDGVDGLVSPGITALYVAVGNLDVNAVEAVVKDGVDVSYTHHDTKYRSVLHELVLSYVAHIQDDPLRKNRQNIKFIDILQIFVRAGLDVNSTDINRQTALHLLASHSGNFDIIRILMTSGLKVNLQDSVLQTALHKAVLKSNASDVGSLLDGGADPNILDSAGHSPLHLAAKRKYNHAIVGLLLDAGADPNLRIQNKNSWGNTSLHVAVKNSNLDAAKALLKYGANYELLDGAGYASVHIAAVNDLTGRVLELLHNYGANLNERDSTYRETPLHKAIKSDMIENFKFLAINGVNPNIPDDIQETPLHKAAVCTKPFTWMTLMKLGGNPNALNRMGLSPLDKAHKAKNQMAVSIMKEYENK